MDFRCVVLVIFCGNVATGVSAESEGLILKKAAVLIFDDSIAQISTTVENALQLVQHVSQDAKHSVAAGLDTSARKVGTFKGVDIRTFASVSVGPLTKQFRDSVVDMAVKALRAHLSIAKASALAEDSLRAKICNSFSVYVEDRFFELISPNGVSSMFFFEMTPVETGLGLSMYVAIGLADGSVELSPEVQYVSRSKRSLVGSKCWIEEHEMVSSFGVEDVGMYMADMMSSSLWRPWTGILRMEGQGVVSESANDPQAGFM